MKSDIQIAQEAEMLPITKVVESLPETTITGVYLYFATPRIFSINETDSANIKKIKELDSILGKYINDYNFRKSIKSGVMNIKVRRGTNILESIVDSLLEISSNYEDGYTRNIYFARWI